VWLYWKTGYAQMSIPNKNVSMDDIHRVLEFFVDNLAREFDLDNDDWDESYDKLLPVLEELFEYPEYRNYN
jgi:hypothetical protein